MTSKGQIRSKANKNLVLGAKPGSLNEFESGGQIYLVYKAQDDPGTDLTFDLLTPIDWHHKLKKTFYQYIDLAQSEFQALITFKL